MKLKEILDKKVTVKEVAIAAGVILIPGSLVVVAGYWVYNKVKNKGEKK